MEGIEGMLQDGRWSSSNLKPEQRFNQPQSFKMWRDWSCFFFSFFLNSSSPAGYFTRHHLLSSTNVLLRFLSEFVLLNQTTTRTIVWPHLGSEQCTNTSLSSMYSLIQDFKSNPQKKTVSFSGFMLSIMPISWDESVFPVSKPFLLHYTLPYSVGCWTERPCMVLYFD